MYFLTMLFASSAFSIRNPGHLRSMSNQLVLDFQIQQLVALASLSFAQLGSQPVYLALPLLPILLAIFFRFFCHSGFVKSRSHPIDPA